MWVTLMKECGAGVTLVTWIRFESLVVPATVMIVAGAAVSFDAGSLMASLLWMVVVDHYRRDTARSHSRTHSQPWPHMARFSANSSWDQ